MSQKVDAMGPEGYETTGVHVADGSDHVVGIGNLHVRLLKEGGHWFAQCLEIDYLVEGDSLEGVKRGFERGLMATIQANLEIHGSIEPMLDPAPASVWKEFCSPKVVSKKYSQVSVHQIEENQDIVNLLPFQAIQYLEATPGG